MIAVMDAPLRQFAGRIQGPSGGNFIQGLVDRPYGYVVPNLYSLRRELETYNNWETVRKFTERRHRVPWNVVFCDGHVEALKTREMTSNEDHSLRRWNNDNLPHRDLFPSP